MDCSVLLLFRHLYSAGSACIAHYCMSCPSIWATLSALLINILLGSFQLFLHSDQPLSEGEIIPFSGVCQSGGGCIIHAGGVRLHQTDQDRFTRNRRRPAATSSRRASFSALASANSFVYFASSAATSMPSPGTLQLPFRQLQFSGIFVASLCR